MMKRRRAGFSLVEMMFVIVIISVVATIAVPTFTGTQNTDFLVSAASEVARGFELARTRALLRNAAMRVIVRRSAAGTLPNIRVDESPDTTCNGWARMATRAIDPDAAESSTSAECSTWLASERYRCGLHVAHITNDVAWKAYGQAGVTILDIQTGEGTSWSDAGDELVVCVNSRGRLLVQSGTSWTPVVGGLLFTFDRMSGGSAMGLERKLYVPQGGVMGVMR